MLHSYLLARQLKKNETSFESKQDNPISLAANQQKLKLKEKLFFVFLFLCAGSSPLVFHYQYLSYTLLLVCSK